MPNDYETRKLYLDALKKQKTLSSYYNNALVNQSSSNDIGSLAAMDTLFQQQNKTPVQEKDLTPKTEEQQEKSLWEKIGGFFSEISTKVLEGLGGAVEGVVDLVATGVSALGEATGWYETEGINEFIQHNYAKDVAEWGRNTDFFTPWGIANQIDSIADGRWAENWYMPFVDENYTANNYVLGDTTMTDGLGGFMSDAAYSIGFMLPSIVAGIATGGGSVGAQAASLAVMGTGAAGKGSEQALNEGATAGQALGYGVASGAVEVVSEIAVGKVLGLIGVGTGKIAGVVGGKAGKSVIKELTKTAFEEGMEEVFSDALAPTIEAIYKGNKSFEQYSDPNYYKNMARSFASGAFVGGLMGGANTAVSRYRYSSEGVSFLENQKELYDLVEEARNDATKNGLTEAQIEEKYGEKIKELTNSMIESFTKLQSKPKAFENLKADLQVQNLDQLKQQIDKPVLDHVADSVSRLVKSSGIADNFDIQFVPEKNLANPDTKAFLDRKTNTVVINELYRDQFANLINHEVLGHLVLDNTELTRNLNDVIESDKKLSEEYHRYDDQLEKAYGTKKNTLASERLARFLESHLHDAKAFSKIFSKTSLAKAKTINLLNNFISKIGRISGIKNINREITGYARQAVAELRKAKAQQAKAEVKPVKQQLEPAYAKKLVKDNDGKERTVHKSIISQEGSKYKTAEKVMPTIWEKEKDANRVIDVFGGTATVAMNVESDNVWLNDNSPAVYDMYNAISSDQYKNATEIYNYIANTISEYNIRTKDGFNKFVEHYNSEPKSKRNGLDLLIVQKFNRSGRVELDENGNLINTYLGHPNSFAQKADVISNIKQTRDALKNMKITNSDFEEIINKAGKGDLLYLDPPYAGTNAVYNRGWTSADDARLMKAIDAAAERGADFVLSNIFSQDGRVNKAWKQWAEKYDVQHFNQRYAKGTADEVVVSKPSTEAVAYAKDLTKANEREATSKITKVGTYGTKAELYKAIQDLYGEGYIVTGDKVYREVDGKKSKLVAEFETYHERTKGGYDARNIDVKKIDGVNIKGIDMDKKINRVKGKIYQTREDFFNALETSLNKYATNNEYSVNDKVIYKNGQPIFELVIPKGAWEYGEHFYSAVNATNIETKKENEKRQPKFKFNETTDMMFGSKVDDILFNLKQQKFNTNNNETVSAVKDALETQLNRVTRDKEGNVTYWKEGEINEANDNTLRFKQDFDDKTKIKTLTISLFTNKVAEVKIKNGQITDYKIERDYNKKVSENLAKIKFEQDQARKQKPDNTKIIENDEEFAETTTLRGIANESVGFKINDIIGNFNTFKRAAPEIEISLSSVDGIIGEIRKFVRQVAPNVKFNEKRGEQVYKTAVDINLNAKADVQKLVDKLTDTFMDSTVEVDGEDHGKPVKTTMTLTEFLEDRGIDSVNKRQEISDALSKMIEDKSKPSQLFKAMQTLFNRIDALNKQVRLDKEIKRNFFKAYREVQKLQEEMKYRGEKIITDIQVNDADFLKKMVHRGWFTKTGNISGSIRKVANNLQQSGYFDSLEKSVVGELLTDTTLIDVFKHLATTYDPNAKVQKVLNVDESRMFTAAVHEIREIYKNYTKGVYEQVEHEAQERFTDANMIHDAIGLGNDGIMKKFLGAAQKVMNPIGVMRTSSVGNEAIQKLLVDDIIELYGNKRMAQADLTQKFQDLVEKSEALKRKDERVKFRNMKMARWNLYGLYLNLQAEYNRESIEKRGYTINTGANTTKDFTYDESLESDLRSELTEKEIADLEEISNFLNGELKEYAEKAGRKASPFFTVLEERYYPMTLSETAKGVNAFNGTIQQGSFFVDASNATWVKQRTGDKNAVRIVNPFTLVASYIDSMTTVAEISPKLQQIDRILNKKIEMFDGKKMSVIDMISSYTPEFSEHYKSYISKLLGRKVSKGKTSLTDVLAGRYSTAVLGLNVGSMLTQAASLPTGMNITGVLSSLKALGKGNTYRFKANHKWLMENNGIYRWRVMDHGMIKGLTTSSSFNQYTQRALNKITEYTLMPMEKLDQLWALMEFGFCEQNVQDTMGYEIGSEENLREANKMFSQVVLETMSNSDPIAKSMLRSGEINKFVQYTFGMFASDAQQKTTLFIQNVVTNYRSHKIAKWAENKLSSGSYGQYTEEQLQKMLNQAKANIKKTNKAVGVYAGTLIASGVIAAMAKLLRDWLYGRKEPEDLVKNPLDFVTDITMETFVDWVPYIGQISSYIKYGNQAAMPLSAAMGIIDTAILFIDATKNGTGFNQAISNFIINLGQFAGLPINNLKNITLGLLKAFDPEAAYKADNFLYGRSSGYMSTNFKNELEKGHTYKAEGLLSTYYDAYKVQNTSSSVIKELTSLYDLGYDNVLAKNYMTTYENENGETVQLSSEQQAQFRNLYNQAESDIEKLISLTDYHSLTQEEQAKAIKKLYNAYYGYAKAKVLGTAGSNKLEKLLIYTNGNIELAKYLLYLSKISNITANKTTSKKDLTLNYINRIRGLSAGEKAMIMFLAGYSVKGTSRTTLESYLRKLGLSKSQLTELLGD